MKTSFRIFTLAIAAAGMAAAGAPDARADECKTLASIGTGINEGIAKFMAEAGLKNIIEDRGYKPAGEVTYKCEAGVIATECSARRRACK